MGKKPLIINPSTDGRTVIPKIFSHMSDNGHKHDFKESLTKRKKFGKALDSFEELRTEGQILFEDSEKQTVDAENLPVGKCQKSINEVVCELLINIFQSEEGYDDDFNCLEISSLNQIRAMSKFKYVENLLYIGEIMMINMTNKFHPDALEAIGELDPKKLILLSSNILELNGKQIRAINKSLSGEQILALTHDDVNTLKDLTANQIQACSYLSSTQIYTLETIIMQLDLKIIISIGTNEIPEGLLKAMNTNILSVKNEMSFAYIKHFTPKQIEPLKGRYNYISAKQWSYLSNFSYEQMEVLVSVGIENISQFINKIMLIKSLEKLNPVNLKTFLISENYSNANLDSVWKTGKVNNSWEL